MLTDTSYSSAEPFVDATVFLGMHSTDSALRRACKYVFTQRFADRILMSLEEVGRCDDIVWRFSRETQDSYYPFMDQLHTEIDFVRIGYSTEDVDRAQRSPELAGLPVSERLLLGMVRNRGGALYSLNPRLLDRPDLPVRAPDPPPPGADDVTFHPALERLYQTSLALRVEVHKL